MYDYSFLLDFIKSVYPSKDQIVLHEPFINKLEENYVLDCLRSGFVSSVGEYVVQAEEDLAAFTGMNHAVCVSSGTSALHTALKVCGVEQGDVVITQSLSFAATANAIVYCGAFPLFIDIDEDTLSLSCEKLENFLKEKTFFKDNAAFLKESKRKIAACVPMHTFGHISKIDEICKICADYNILVIEDAAEAVGSYYKGKHAGSFGIAGILSFNGNKTITCGGGGAVLTNNEAFAKKAKHLSTTAKIPNTNYHEHDMIGFNYRMPNLNASLLCAQLKRLDDFILKKRTLGKKYKEICSKNSLLFFDEPLNCKSNFWLNSVIFEDKDTCNNFIKEANKQNIFPRHVWKPLHLLGLYKTFENLNLDVTENLYEKIVNLPSSVPEKI